MRAWRDRGELDARALFYLESRGIPPQPAKALLTRAFVADALARIGEEAVRDALYGGRGSVAGRMTAPPPPARSIAFRISRDSRGWSYLDTAATAQKPRAVIDAIRAGYGETYATVHRGVYQRSAGDDAGVRGEPAAGGALHRRGIADEIVLRAGRDRGDQPCRP
jgi:hypothetical protein